MSTKMIFDLRPRRGIQIDILGEAFLMRRHDGMQAHRVVQAGFDVACAARGCAVEIADLHADRLCAALEIRADRRRKDTELIVVRGLHADDRADAECVGTDI